MCQTLIDESHLLSNIRYEVMGRSPLKMVMIPVVIIANQEPYGWKGALYGRESREMP